MELHSVGVSFAFLYAAIELELTLFVFFKKQKTLAPFFYCVFAAPIYIKMYYSYFFFINDDNNNFMTSLLHQSYLGYLSDRTNLIKRAA